MNRDHITHAEWQHADLRRTQFSFLNVHCTMVILLHNRIILIVIRLDVDKLNFTLTGQVKDNQSLAPR